MEGCYKLLRKTPPKGEKFAAAIEVGLFFYGIYSNLISALLENIGK